MAAGVGRNLPIPCTVFLLLIGMVLATLSDSVAAFGIHLDARQLLKDIALVFVLAAPALVCHSLLLLLIGLSVDLRVLVGDLDGILVAALLVLIARVAAVYSLIPVTVRLFSLPKVHMGEQHIMWWGGSRADSR